MSDEKQKKLDGSENVSEKEPRTLRFSARGITTGNDFANLMSALMADLIDGRMTPDIGNAICNAGGKLLKVVEMQHRYGTRGKAEQKIKTLRLASGK